MSRLAVDDATLLAYVEVLPDEQQSTTVGFQMRAVAWFSEQGMTCRRILSDNVPRQAPWPLATNKLAALAGLICPLNSFPSKAVRLEPGVFHGDKHDPGDTKSGPPAWWSPVRACILVIGTGRQLPWPLLSLCSAWRRRRIVVPGTLRRTFRATARAGGHHGPPAAGASPPVPGQFGTSLSPGDNYPLPWFLA